MGGKHIIYTFKDVQFLKLLKKYKKEEDDGNKLNVYMYLCFKTKNQIQKMMLSQFPSPNEM
jgi:hypothetical protein